MNGPAHSIRCSRAKRNNQWATIRLEVNVYRSADRRRQQVHAPGDPRTRRRVDFRGLGATGMRLAKAHAVALCESVLERAR